MDLRTAVGRLLDLCMEDDGPDHDGTAREILDAVCVQLSFAVASDATSPEMRERVGECVGAVNMVLEIWDMGSAEVVSEPYIDEYDLGWCCLN